MSDETNDKKTPWSYRAWYELNASKLSETRRKKYAEDKEHREKILQANRDWRARQSSKELNKAEIKVKMPKARKPIAMSIGGKKCELVYVGAVARQIGRGTATVRHWERAGLLPK